MPDANKETLPEPLELEIIDLEIAEHESNLQPTSAFGQLLLRWQQPERRSMRRLLRRVTLVTLLCLLLAILLNASGAFTTLWAASQQSTRGAMAHVSTSALPPPASDIICPLQTAWSPDSSLIAVLGYTQPCVSGQYEVAQVDLYQAATARQVMRLQPDNAILAALQQAIPPAMWASLDHKPAPDQTSVGMPAPAITYQEIIWSPAQTQLALSFSVNARYASYAGLLLFTLSTRQQHVLLLTQPTSAAPRDDSALLWDLHNGTGSLLPALTPSLSYSWSHDDRLLANLPLSPDASSATYTEAAPGNPDGGSSFTIWQPGQSIVLSSIHIPSAYLWHTSFAAWSPDGRYLLAHFGFDGLMEPPGQATLSAEARQSMQIDSLPQIPAHDPALIPSSAMALNMAWNPAGTLLAVYDLSGQIDLYRCQTGQLLQTLQPKQQGSTSLSGSTELLRWSPDGRALLLTSSQWGLVYIWHATFS